MATICMIIIIVLLGSGLHVEYLNSADPLLIMKCKIYLY